MIFRVIAHGFSGYRPWFFGLSPMLTPPEHRPRLGSEGPKGLKGLKGLKKERSRARAYAHVHARARALIQASGLAAANSLGSGSQAAHISSGFACAKTQSGVPAATAALAGKRSRHSRQLIAADPASPASELTRRWRRRNSQPREESCAFEEGRRAGQEATAAKPA